jgi:serine/threonine protein kinase
MTNETIEVRDWVPPSPEELAAEIPGLRVDQLVTQGGMAAIYVACQISLERYVAIKVLAPAMQQTPEGYEQFANEARLLAQLHEQSVVAVHDFGRTESGWTYMVMEWLDGISLAAWMKNEPDLERRKSACAQLCDAISTVHAKGIIHGDLKPDNALIIEDDKLKLIDFGIAMRAGQGQGSDVRWGTPPYTAPEASDFSRPLDEKSDLYSLAVVIWEVLTGSSPGDGSGKSPEPHIAEILLNHLSELPEERTASLAYLQTALLLNSKAAAPMLSTTMVGAPEKKGMTFGRFLVAAVVMVGTMVLVKKMSEPDDGPSLSPPKLAEASAVPEPVVPPIKEADPEPEPEPETVVVALGPTETPVVPEIIMDPDLIFTEVVRDSAMASAKPDPVIDPEPEPEAEIEAPPRVSVEAQKIVAMYVAALEREETAEKDPAVAAKISAEIDRVSQSPAAAELQADDPPVLMKFKPILAGQLKKLAEDEMPEASIFWQVDDMAELYINGTKVEEDGFAWAHHDNYRKIHYVQAKLKAGDVIAFKLIDTGNEESFLAAVFCGSRFLFGTDLSWQASLDLNPKPEWYGNMELEAEPASMRKDNPGKDFRRWVNVERLESRTVSIWGSGGRNSAVRKQLTAEDLKNLRPLPELITKPVSGQPSSESLLFENSLGMRFVPLPGGGMMCKTETRHQDYERFMKESTHVSEGKTRSVVSKWESSHRTWFANAQDTDKDCPVVLVNLRDAQAFCVWLTEREQRNGWISGNARYAVPLIDQYKRAWGSGIYPWGSEWPPPEGVANLPGTEADEVKEPFKMAESDWSDAWPSLAPGDALTPNEFGFSGLVGNVWEHLATGDMVGGSWAEGTREQCMKGKITPVETEMRHDHLGFRCVLLFD